MAKKGIEVAGMTVDGKPAFKGVFKLQDTFGLPLILMWQQLFDDGAVIAWDHYIQDAYKAGWSKAKVISGIREIAQFGYQGEEGREFFSRIARMMEAANG